MNVSYRTAVLAIALAIAPQTAFAQMMAPPVPMTAAEFAGVRPGQSIHIAVRVTARTKFALRAELLQSRTEKIYTATGRRVVLYVPAQVPIVMGSANDIGPGAIVYVDGVATTPGRADVKRVVVLTQYIEVERR